jgi:hypothetical protein
MLDSSSSQSPYRLLNRVSNRHTTFYFLRFSTLVHISISPFLASLSGNGAMAAMALSM